MEEIVAFDVESDFLVHTDSRNPRGNWVAHSKETEVTLAVN